jgi:hypothetical protein
MAQTPPPSMTAPPTAPSRSDSANFASRGDAFLGWFATQYTDLVAALANVYANAVDCYNNAVAAAASAAAALASQSAAAASAQAAATSAGATIWVSGTTYAIGDVRWSPSTRFVYRRITAGAGTTDPSADATNWALASAALPQLVAVAGTTQTAVANGHYSLDNAAVSTLTLPAAPTAGDAVWVTASNGRADNIVARNGQKIMSLAEDMTLDGVYRTASLRYINATVGWVLV